MTGLHAAGRGTSVWTGVCGTLEEQSLPGSSEVDGGRRESILDGSWDNAMSFCSFFGGEKYKDHFENGMYVCAQCGYELFSSRTKFEHSSPWPAFTETIHEDSVSKYVERPNALKVSCGKCGNGLGHEFLNDGPKRGQSRF